MALEIKILWHYGKIVKERKNLEESYEDDGYCRVTPCR